MVDPRRRFMWLLFPLFLFACDKQVEILSGPDIGVSGDIAIYADDGAAPGCVGPAELMFQWMGHSTTRIYVDDVNNGLLDSFDLIYFPGGNSEYYRTDITDTGGDHIRTFVRDGGGYIGTCAGAYFACEVKIWDGGDRSEGILGLYPGRAEGPINEIYEYPAHGMCDVIYTEPRHPITAKMPYSDSIYYWWGPFFTPYDETRSVTLANYEITGQPALVCCDYGEGRVFLTGPHPEWEEDSDRDGYPPEEYNDDNGSDWPMMKCATAWCLGG